MIISSVEPGRPGARCAITIWEFVSKNQRTILRIKLKQVFSAHCFEIYTRIPCQWNPLCLKVKVDLSIMFKPQQTGCNEIRRLKLLAYIVFSTLLCPYVPVMFFSGALSNLPEQIHRSYWQSKILHLINLVYFQFFSHSHWPRVRVNFHVCCNCTIQSYLEQKSPKERR